MLKSINPPIAEFRDRLGPIMLNLDQVQYVRAMPKLSDGDWTFVAMPGRDFELHCSLEEFMSVWTRVRTYEYQ